MQHVRVDVFGVGAWACYILADVFVGAHTIGQVLKPSDEGLCLAHEFLAHDTRLLTPHCLMCFDAGQPTHQWQN